MPGGDESDDDGEADEQGDRRLEALDRKGQDEHQGDEAQEQARDDPDVVAYAKRLAFVLAHRCTPP